MKRIKEIKQGVTSVFIVETLIDQVVTETNKVDVKLSKVQRDGQIIYLLYDSQRNIIESAYDFLNHSGKLVAEKTRSVSAYNLKFLFSYCEIFDKDYTKLDKNDFTRLAYFLKGVSADESQMQLKLIANRQSHTVNIMFSTYRNFYKKMNIKAPIFDEAPFSRFIPFGFNNRTESKVPLRAVKNNDVPKYISVADFKKIIFWIRENIDNKERALRDECLCRVMYEGGLRLGEALGSTLEDYVIQETETGDEICFIYIRNRVSDHRRFQSAKTCMKVFSVKDYDMPEYRTKNVGYQLSFLSVDTYDRICEYIDIAHDRCRQEHRRQYDSRMADAVGDYKESGMDNYYLFLNTKKATPMSEENWRTELRMIFDGVGIDIDYGRKRNGLSHRFRHGFVMHLLYDLKMPAYKVRIRSRHASEGGLSKYINPTVDQIIAEKIAIEKDILGSEEVD